MSLPDQIPSPLKRALDAKGYAELTPVQSAMLEADMAGADLLVSAQTGSGKTVAFGMAIAGTLLDGKETLGIAVQPLALVVAPTRELALQVRRELEWLYAEAGARLASCVGGMEMRKEIRSLQQGAHIVVGTPGRLRDHITRGSLDLEGLRAVVLDEADEMLDLGFREDLEFILDASPKERRMLMFSATVPAQIGKMAAKYQRDAMRISAGAEKKQHADIEYRLMPVAPHERENAIINALLYFDAPSTMVFCSTREAVKHLASRLGNRGFGVVALSGELSQAERTNALQAMRDGRARVCVATDVAARGIDLPNLDLVIHADLPTNPDTLLHRSGRTGRAGRKGICILVAPMHRRRSAERLLSLAKVQATQVRAPSQADIYDRDRERLLNGVTSDSGASDDETETVAELLKRHSAEAVALAYVRMVQASRPTAEYLSETGIPETAAPSGQKESERFDNGVWFRIPQGRKHNVEPRWLLPTLCKAGHVTKRDIGFIRLLDHETRFEIRPERAEAFFEAISNAKGGEKGLRVARFVGDPSVLPPRKGPDGLRPDFKSRSERVDDKARGERPEPRSTGESVAPREKKRWSSSEKKAAKKGREQSHSASSGPSGEVASKPWGKPKPSAKPFDKPRKPFKGKGKPNG